MKIVAIIPARMASTRFPGKPLVKINGHAMIEHVYRRVLRSKLIDEVYVATCDREIADEVAKWNGKSIMTSSHHTRGTDRVAEAVHDMQADIVINVQGDEPMVDPAALDEAVVFMQKRQNIRCLNLIAPISDWNVFTSKDVVKVTLDKNSRILYFSRQPIPHCEQNDFAGAFKQIGIYLVYKDLLLNFTTWAETHLEKIEKVDMLRFLENGASVYSFVSKDMRGVDTPGDLVIVEKVLLSDPLYQKIFEHGRLSH